MTNRLSVSLSYQRLTLQDEHGTVISRYRVSTAANGPGERNGSGCTPRGEHHIRIAIGAGCPADTVFVGRRPTGERYTSALAQRFPERDWILSRILWLSGNEPGFNRGGECDTLRRMIYIHGTPQTEPLGTPASHGCIRMASEDLIELFDQVGAGTLVTL